jgi:uncharacterized protein YlaN (UPF0358 family)
VLDKRKYGIEKRGNFIKNWELIQRDQNKKAFPVLKTFSSLRVNPRAVLFG